MAIKRPLPGQPRLSDAAVAAPRVTALLYYRLSKLADDRDVDGSSKAKQRGRCFRVAEIEGAEVLGEYSDDNISAAYDVRYEDKPRHRPDFRRLLADIERLRPTFVISVYGDRLRRNQEEWIELVKVCARTGTKLRDETSTLDLRDANDRMRGTFDTLMFEAYVESIRTKVSSHLAERRRNGVPRWGGRRYYGFDEDKVTPREDEAKWVRWIADRVVAGQPLRSIARELNEQGVPTPSVSTGASTSGEWVRQTVKQTVTRAMNCGWIEHRGEMVRPFAVVESGEVDTILDRETFDRVVAVLSSPTPVQSGRGRGGTNGHFLSGLLRCGIDGCRGSLHGSTRALSDGTRVRVYRCERAHLSIRADEVEAHVGELVVALRSSKDHVHGIAEAAEDRSAQWKELHDRYIDAAAEVDRLADEDPEGEARRRYIDRRIAKLDGVMSKLKAEMDKLDPTDPNRARKLQVQAARRVRTRWESAVDDPAIRRSMVLDVVAGFRVAPVGRGKRGPVGDRLQTIPLGGVTPGDR